MCMNSKVKVSVLVPVYNVEKYLSQCLDSLCAQTLKDIEFICINDGSTDDSGNILQAYAKKDSRFKIINKTNSGYGDSMNFGLNEAKGEFIGIVESDDFAEPDMFEKLYSLAYDNQLDIVKSNCFFYSTKDSAECNEKVDVFDVYQGEHLGQGLKSIAVSITYQDSSKTLKDDEINEVEQNLIALLAKTYKAELRK